MHLRTESLIEAVLQATVPWETPPSADAPGQSVHGAEMTMLRRISWPEESDCHAEDGTGPGVKEMTTAREHAGSESAVRHGHA
jgi:hypothetical protein